MLFCQDITITSNSVPKNLHSNATLYLLSQHPPRTDREIISNISKQMSLSSIGIDYYSYILDLNVGANVEIDACYLASNPDAKVEFYLLKGTKNFNKWVGDWIFHSGSYIEMYSKLSSACQTVSYHAQKADKYYFVFYKDPFGDNMKANFQIDRPAYHVSLDTVVNSCTIPLDGESSCSLSVPMSSEYTALMSLHAGSFPIHYPDGADVSIKCQPRGWLYTIVVICALVGAILSIALLVAIGRAVVKRRKLSMYSPVRSRSE